MKFKLSNLIIAAGICMMGLSLAKPSVVSTPSPVPSKSDNFFDRFFDPGFFHRSYDPFEEMRHIRSQMLKEFEAAEKNISAFDVWFQQKYGGNIADIHQREDKEKVYYDIFVNNLLNQKVDVKVAKGMITINGFLEKKENHAVEATSFSRTFPAPSNIDSNHVQIEYEPNKIIVKFQKKYQ